MKHNPDFYLDQNQRPVYRPPTLAEYAMAKKEHGMIECIIIERAVCPHEDISGKTCSECKIPDNGVFCDSCGMYNTDVESSINDGKCFNCNTKL